MNWKKVKEIVTRNPESKQLKELAKQNEEALQEILKDLCNNREFSTDEFERYCEEHGF